MPLGCYLHPRHDFGSNQVQFDEFCWLFFRLKKINLWTDVLAERHAIVQVGISKTNYGKINWHISIRSWLNAWIDNSFSSRNDMKRLVRNNHLPVAPCSSRWKVIHWAVLTGLHPAYLDSSVWPLYPQSQQIKFRFYSIDALARRLINVIETFPDVSCCVVTAHSNHVKIDWLSCAVSGIYWYGTRVARRRCPTTTCRN